MKKSLVTSIVLVLTVGTFLLGSRLASPPTVSAYMPIPLISPTPSILSISPSAIGQPFSAESTLSNSCTDVPNGSCVETHLGLSLCLLNNICVVKVDLNNASIRPRAVVAPNGNTAWLDSLATSVGGIAAINGDYFSGCPDGTSPLNCGEGLTFVGGTDYTDYTGSEWQVRRSLGFNDSYDPNIGWHGEQGGYHWQALGGGPQVTFGGEYRWRCWYQGFDTEGNCWCQDNTVVINDEQFSCSADHWWSTSQSFIGFSDDRNTLYFAKSVPGYNKTPHEMHDVLWVHGARHTLKLDGGGSSGMYFNDGGYSFSWNGSRSVANAWVIVPGGSEPTPTPSPGCNPNTDQVALYVDSSYGGQCMVKEIGEYSNPAAIGLPNDAISSLRVGGNVKATLCRDDNYGGGCETFTGDDSNLSDNSIGDNQVSSVKVEPRACSPNADQIALFANTNYDGVCIVLDIGDYSAPAYLSPLGNDDAESIKVGSNVEAILYEHSDYAGTSEIFTGDDSNLGDNPIGANRVSSVKIQQRSPTPTPTPTLTPTPTQTPTPTDTPTPTSECIGSTGPEGTCCTYGHVYYDGVPVAGASVHIEGPNGILDTNTANGEASSQPYYNVDFCSLASPGNVVTVTGTYEGSSVSTVYEVAPGGQRVDVVVPVNFVFGDGRDGDLIIGDGQTIYADNMHQPLSAPVSIGQNILSVPSTVGFAVNDEVLVIQMQGTGVGAYEFGIIASVGSGTLTLQQNLQNTYTVGGNSKAQIVRVPQYRSVTVQNNGILTAHPWDGSTGGILILACSEKLDVQSGGKILALGHGFRAGQRETDKLEPSSGEGTAGPQVIDQYTVNGNGGGCGWPKDSEDNVGGGGGNGAVGGDGHGTGGAGGNIAGSADLTTLVLGGGAGGNTDARLGILPGISGNGGGAVILLCKDVNIGGTLNANGQDGWTQQPGQTNAGTGGSGGGGGSILIHAQEATLGTNLVTAGGGNGSSGEHGKANGANGGDGRIRIEYGTLSGSTDPSASTQQKDFLRAPIATIHTVYPNPAVQGQDIITFRGSAVDNDEDGASITQYIWRSDLDGLLSNRAIFTRTASGLSVGTHTIYFETEDDEGERSEEISTTLQVLGSPPVASFTVSPTNGYTTTVFEFDASGCSDAEDPVTSLEVRWDWESDGIFDTDWNAAKVTSHTYAATGTYTIYLQVRDTEGMMSSTIHTVMVSDIAVSETFIKLLVPGWNLVSLPLHLMDNAIAQILAPITGSYDLVYTYDGCNPADPWKKYSPFAPPFANDLTELDETTGFWIHMTVTDTLVVTGMVPGASAIPMCVGWNLVGYPSLQTRLTAEVLASIEEEYDIVYAYDASDAIDPWKKYDPGAPLFANDLSEMAPGWSYWIKVNQNGVWTVID